MERRSPAARVARNVELAVGTFTCPTQTISEATDIRASDLVSRLSNESPFTLSELVRVGGLLRVSPDKFFAGVA